MTSAPEPRGEELLPCPAGHAAKLHQCKRGDERDPYTFGWFYVECVEAECGWHCGGFPDTQAAIAAWNVTQRESDEPITRPCNRCRSTGKVAGCYGAGSTRNCRECHGRGYHFTTSVKEIRAGATIRTQHDTIARLHREAEGLRRELEEARRALADARNGICFNVVLPSSETQG